MLTIRKKLPTFKGVQVNGTALTPTNNVVNITGTIEKLATAESGFAASYQLKMNGVAVGDKINIAKDWLLKAAELKIYTVSDYETSPASDCKQNGFSSSLEENPFCLQSVPDTKVFGVGLFFALRAI